MPTAVVQICRLNVKRNKYLYTEKVYGSRVKCWDDKSLKPTYEINENVYECLINTHKHSTTMKAMS